MLAIVFRLALFLGLAVPVSALAARSDWSSADESRMRLLLAAPQERNPAIVGGGIEILLEPGWYTYWRNPGEAGVPPVFDFSGSENVAHVEVLYPAPIRHDDGASVSLIYRDEVVFPLSVTPTEPGLPVTLRVEARFGVCQAICIPTRAESKVTLEPVPEADPLSDARLASFVRRVPKAAEAGRFAIENVHDEGDALMIDVRSPGSTYADLFADPPAGWYIGQPVFVSRSDGVSRYRLSLAGRPPDVRPTGQTFRFVAVAGGEAIEELIEIR